MVELLGLILRLTADVEAQASQKLFIHIADNHGEMGRATTKLGKLLLSQLCQGICQGGNGESHQYLIGMEAGVAVAQVPGFELADRLQNLCGDQFKVVINAPHRLQRVQ